jgi:TRAP-type C4-dicarboxylate transport system substrate-binding protein
MITRRKFVAASSAAFVAAPFVRTASAAVTFDLATVWPESNFHTQNARRFAAEVEKATGGEVKINVQSGGSLGFKGPELLVNVRDGVVPIADILNIQQVGVEPILGIESIPFLLDSLEELKILHKHIRPLYEAVATKYNQKVLYMAPWPTQYLHLKIKTDTVEGLKGIKIRVPDKNAQEMCALIGMAPALIPWGETIPALASGAISGVSTSAVSGVDGKFWEFLKYAYKTNHGFPCQMVNINNDALKKVSAAGQQKLVEVGKTMEPDFWKVSDKADSDSAKRLVEGGMEIITVPGPMMADFRKRVSPMITDFMKRVPASAAPIKAFLAEVKRSA